MRNDLKGVLGVSDVITDVDQRTVQFNVLPGIDVESMLNQLIETNDKLKDWELIEKE